VTPSIRSFLDAYAGDPMRFFGDVRVDAADGRAIPFREVADGWQLDDLRAIAPALLAMHGRPPADPPTYRHYWERPRGHAKSSDSALIVADALCFAPRPITGLVLAGDEQQGQVLRKAVWRLVSRNPWMNWFLRVDRSAVVNVAAGSPGEGSEVRVVSRDASGLHGELPDLLVIDELTNWPQGDSLQELWQVAVSLAAKRPYTVVLVTANAGLDGGWQWQAREAARTDPAWRFSSLDGPVASWINEATLAEQQRMLLPSQYQRLWGNRWTTGTDSGFLPALIDAAVGYVPPEIRKPRPGRSILVGVDLATRVDHASVVATQVDPFGRKVRVIEVHDWDPRDFGGEVPLGLIERVLLDMRPRLAPDAVMVDAYQAVYIAQRLAGMGLPLFTVQMNSSACNSQARAAVTVLSEEILVLPEGTAEERLLVEDFRRATIAERSGGQLKVESPRQKETGHGDRLSALLLTLPWALREIEDGVGEEGEAAPEVIHASW
jgi:hypothetical protein